MSVSVRWLGHSAFWLEIDGFRVMIDPYLTGNPAATVAPGDLSPDFIAITHGHGDHVGDAIEIARRTGALVIANSEIIRWLRGKGLSHLHAQHIGGGFHHPFGYLKLTIAHHGSSLPDGSYGGEPAGILITTKGGAKLYFAGDTGLFASMALYGDEGLDFAALPIGDNYTMGPEDAFRAVGLLRPRLVIPFHFNTWEAIAVDAAGWVARVNTGTSSEARLLAPGDSVVIEA